MCRHRRGYQELTISWLAVLAADVGTASVELKRGDPPQHLIDYNQEMLGYLLCNYKAERRAHTGKHSSSSELHEVIPSKYRRSAEKFFAFVYLADNGEEVHYCRSTSCCSGYDITVCHAEARKLKREVLLHAMPDKPENGKWTKLGNAIDFQVANRPGKRLHKAWCAAFSHIEVKYQARADADSKKHREKRDQQSGAETDDHPNIAEEKLSWHACASSRCKKGTASLADPIAFALATAVAFCSGGVGPIFWLSGNFNVNGPFATDTMRCLF